MTTRLGALHDERVGSGVESGLRLGRRADLKPHPRSDVLQHVDPSGRRVVLGGWGSGGLRHIESRALAEYEHAFTGDAIHAMCEDYRASAGIDLVHDQESRDRGDKIRCDTHVLWGERGVVHRFFDALQLWQAQCLGEVTGRPMPAGHFIPEELPSGTERALNEFFGAGTTG